MLAEFLVLAALKGSVLDEIERCESGGRNVMNYMHSVNPSYYTAGGYYQITNGTWRDFGGSEFAPTAIEATKAQQKVVAERILAARGTQPWNASRSCWIGSVGTTTPPKHSKPSTAAPSTTKAPSGSSPKHSKTYTVKTGDTLSEIAEAHGTTWQDLYQKNPDITDPDLIFVGQTINL